MYLGKVIGSLEATVVCPGLEGLKLLWIEPLSSDGERSGDALVACDATQAGPGDRVFWVDGREATLAFEESFIPVDAAVVGIVDRVDRG